jgi:hypothetical protein
MAEDRFESSEVGMRKSEKRLKTEQVGNNSPGSEMLDKRMFLFFKQWPLRTLPINGRSRPATTSVVVDGRQYKMKEDYYEKLWKSQSI